MVFKPVLTESDFDDPKFDYVVSLQRGEKLCFGSKLPRYTGLIGRGLSPHQLRLAPELFWKTGPGCYHTEECSSAMYEVLNKVRSKAGVGPLASKDNRFKTKIRFRTPSPGRYQPPVPSWKLPKRNFAPFNNSSKVREMKVSSTPGPLTYDIRKVSKCRRMRYMSNFGRPTMVPCVELICVVKPTDTCQKCQNLCEGDYWHLNHETFLCQLCWFNEKIHKTLYNENDFGEFKKIRNCSFMHSHEKTNAALRILPQNKINKKVRLENYLDLYIKC
nr:uncharacterized protein LOC111515413 [Leptinotarsa decemlineata]